ncbi:MAG: contractile injection system protein, VgrG/Pvc8 family [Sphingomonadales bacterium]
MPTPDFRLTLDGRDLSPSVRPRLVQLTLTEKRDADADQLDITLADTDGRLAIPPAGAVLTLALGWRETGLVDKGSFRVDEVEHSGTPDQLVIRARAADFTAAGRVRRVDAVTGQTLGQIITSIAGRLGLAAQVAPALAGVAVPVLDQAGLSDLALLKLLGRRHDAVATIKAGRLLFSPIGAGTTASGMVLPGASITRADGDQHSWRRAARDTYSGVTAYWHDPDAAERKGVTAGSTGEGDGHAKRLKRTYGNEADARAAAEAEHGRQQRGAATMGLTLALGRPDLYPEQRLTLSGWGKPQIDGATWLVTECRHDLNSQGFTTQLGLELGI